MSDSTVTAELNPGDMVYDLGQDPPTAMVVVDTDLPTVSGLEGDLYRAVRTNDTNLDIGFDADTPCVRAVYVDPDREPKKPYTFPVTRLVRPRVENASRVDGTAYELAAAEFLRRLLSGAAPGSAFWTDLLDAADNAAGLSTSAILYAENMAKLDRENNDD